MSDLKKEIEKAQRKKIAIGHFNVSDISALRGIFKAALELKKPIIIGTSEGEREFLNSFGIASFVKRLREVSKFPIFINADHTYSVEKIKEAVKAGYDAILVDYSSLQLEQNIKKTKAAVEYIKSENEEILVEGEIGYIGAGSTVLKEIPKEATVKLEQLPTAEEVERFIKETKVDLVAPAVGNLHGILANAPMPSLQISRIQEIKNKTRIPLVLHGGTGLKKEDFQNAIAAGVSIIHISTELRIAWRKSLEESLKANPEEIAPYKLLAKVSDAIYAASKEKIEIFSFI